MILQFSVTNTLSIKEKQTISFEAIANGEESEKKHFIETPDNKKIQKLICIYGANASGKSNLLVSFNFYLDFITNSFSELRPDQETQFVPFLFVKDIANSEGEFELVFYGPNIIGDNEVKYEYKLKLTKEKVIEESLHFAPKGQKKIIFERKNQKVRWGTDVTGQKKVISDLTRPNCSIISAGAQANHPVFTTIYTHLKQRNKGIIQPDFNRIPTGLYKNLEENQKFKGKMIALLNAFDISSISDIKIKSEDVPKELLEFFSRRERGLNNVDSDKPKIRTADFVHKIGNDMYDLPVSLESSGTMKIMELTQPLIDLTKSTVLLMDEIESSLHPVILENFLKLFLNISNTSQLIFTTHNLDLLESNLLLDSEIIFCDKDENCCSKYTAIPDYKGIRKGISRKSLYNSNRLGKLPNVNIEELTKLFIE